MLWAYGLRRFLKHGSLTVVDAEGRTHQFGNGEVPACRIRLHDKALHWKLLVNPKLCFGEAYTDGTLTIEQGTLPELLNMLAYNLHLFEGPRGMEQVVAPLLNRILQFNPLERSRENVERHYDLSNDFYRLFLDEDMQYSCAYFTQPQATLEEAQWAKKAHIAAKLLLQPGMQVLDIGCGWGGMAIFLAREFGVQVTGITLSSEQHALATQRVRAAGLEGQVEIVLRDYRHQEGSFDRIVSVGMFEHVGPGHHAEFFRKMQALLKPDGVALLHSIGRSDGPGIPNAWIRKYVFPGAGAPALSSVVPEIERSGLWMTDVEILRLHYARTLDEWQARFQQHRAEVAARYDERFCRLWEFYLAATSAFFRFGGLMVFQIQMSRQIGAVPITRDYIGQSEQLLRMPAAVKRSRAA